MTPSQTTSPSDEDRLVWANSYAAKGWPVLPLKPRDKTPLTSHGLLDASNDLAQIEAWWQRWPDANIGLRTGVAFDVLDLDGDVGMASLLAHVPGYKHAGPVSLTGRGYHLLFAATGARNGANLLPKVDFRGQNGYIVAPPSIHPSGSVYEWNRKRFHLPLPEAPDWLLQLVIPEPVVRRSSPVSNDPELQAVLTTFSLVSELGKLGAINWQRAGGNRLKTNCVFHQDDTPSMVVYLANDPESFYCFGCGAWGDVANVLTYQRKGVLR